MGLDQYAYVAPANAYEGEVDFRVTEVVTEISYWRKHNALQGWMEQLYRANGGTEDSFNCVNVNLTMDDLAALEKAVTQQALPETQGFFFGNDSSKDEYYRIKDLEFIARARQELLDGNKVYYSSWW